MAMHSQMTRLDERSDFTATSWTLVHAACSPDASMRSDAMDEICRRYWGPIYQFLRRSGRDAEQAAELTQDFFTRRIIDGAVLHGADRDRGQLRQYMLQSARNMARDAARAAGTRSKHERIAAERRASEERVGSAYAACSPTDAFLGRAALQILRDAVRSAETRIATSRVPVRWKVFERVFLTPLYRDADPPPQEVVAEEFGLSRVNQVGEWRDACLRAIEDALHERIASEMTDPDEVEAEVALLMGSLRPRAS